MPEKTPRVTEEQANEALHQLLAEHKTASQPELPIQTAPVAAATVEPESPAEEPAQDEPSAATETDESEQEAAAESSVSESDDVASLKQRLAETEKARTEQERLFKDRLEAHQQRANENQRILNDRFMRKATVADRALRTLRAVRTVEGGIPEADVDRVIQEIEASMNPATPSYAPLPQPQAEDQAIILNSFLNENGMTATEADEFGKWIRTDAPNVMPASEQQVAARDIDGFLRLALNRYEQSKRDKAKERTSAVEAVKTVQRTQKQAAKAASATPAAPRKTTVTSTPPNTVDYAKVTPEMVSKWARQSVEQYK